MSDEAPAVATAPVEGSNAPSEAVPVVGGDAASAVPGNAPGGGDVPAEGAAAGEVPSVSTPAEFLFGSRSFRDQKHAEEVLGGEINAKRGLQRQNAEVTRERDGLRAEIDALRGLIPKAGGQGQGKTEEESFAEKLAKRQDGLAFYESLVLNQDGTLKPGGLQQAFFALVQDSDKHNSERLDARFDELRQELGAEKAHTQQEQTIARAFTATKSLYSEFPELDEANRSEEAQWRQDAILQLLQSGPQDWLATNPEAALRWAAGEVRRTYGTPVFAQAPGTSESPSASAARAAEATAAATASEPLDGTGVPRQRPNGQPVTLADQWRTESSRPEARTKGGRPLGFPEPM